MYILEYYNIKSRPSDLSDESTTDMPRGGPGGVSSKQPGLQSIGRSQSVDWEEPPASPDSGGDDAEDEFDAFAQTYDSDGVYCYRPEHAEQAAAHMDQRFQLLQPGGHVSLRRPGGAGGASFSHCRFSVEFADKAAELRTLLEHRARLSLVRDYTSRLNAAAMFVREVEAVVQEEYRTWHHIVHNTLDDPPTTKLECLSAICDDLRCHMNHWNSIKTSVHADRWLKSQLPTLFRQIAPVRLHLLRLRDSALFWLERLIHVGFRVLAHCDTTRSGLTHDALWGITRGLEDFNTIAAAVRGGQCGDPGGGGGGSRSYFPQSLGLPEHSPLHVARTSRGKKSPGESRHFHAFHKGAMFSNSYASLLDAVKPVPFVRVLNLLACERAKYAAAMTHQFFSANEDLMRMVLKRKLPADYDWSEDNVRPTNRTAATTNPPPPSRMNSDSALSDTDSLVLSPGSVFTPPHVSASAAMLRVAPNLVAPDLSKQMSPVVDFTRREQEFAGKFLQIVCSSTGLLKKPANIPAGAQTQQQQPKVKRVSLRYQNHPTYRPDTMTPPRVLRGAGAGAAAGTEDVLAPLPGRGAGAAGGKQALERGGAGRKSVSWGDSAEISIIQTLTYKYLELLWAAFGAALYEFFLAPVHGGAEASAGQLGNIGVVGNVVTVTVARTIAHTCVKDIFPAGAVGPLGAVAKRLLADAAWTSWDSALCRALASAASDRCSAPVALRSGEFCSRTAALLRDAYQPLHSVITATLETSDTDSTDATDKDPPKPPRDPSLLLPTLRRLARTAEISENWCHLRSAQYLASWSLQPFLLVSQSDLKVLSDECRHALFECQRVCPGGGATLSGTRRSQKLGPAPLVEQQAQAQLGAAWTQLSDSAAQIQTLSGSSVRQFSETCSKQALDFFEDNMPTGKVWRKKSTHELPTASQDYIEHAMDTLLDPVLSGVTKLKPAAQIGAVSMATTAVCEAWTDYILRQRIRFSLHGAHQLGLDFGYVVTWLQTMIPSEDVKRSVLALDIFKYLHGIVDLLKRQQRGRTGSRAPKDRQQLQQLPADDTTKQKQMKENGRKSKVLPFPNLTSPSSCDFSLSSTTSTNQWSSHHVGAAGSNSALNGGNAGDHGDAGAALSANGTSPEHPGAGGYRVPHREQWLALRVQGGARSWPKLPSCFHSTQ